MNRAPMPRRVEIGCSTRKREGFFGIDIVSDVGVDLVADINRGIPLCDNSVEHLLFTHSFEHFSNFMFIVSEMWRVCKNKALIEIYAPYYTNIINLSNPYHKIYLTEYTFLFFADKECKFPKEVGPYSLSAGTANEGYNMRFRQEEVNFIYFEPWNKKTKAEQDFARLHYLHVVRDIHIRLCVIKEML